MRPDSSKVMAALEKRYRAPEWALLAQVGNSTGAGANRWADAVALSLWPSRGIYLHGFEIKVYRNDWLRELHNPAKAETMATRTDYWWVVVGGPGIATADEMPGAWGLLELTGRGLVTRKSAIARVPAPDLDRNLVAAILRRATETMIPRAAIRDSLDDQYKNGVERGKQDARLDNGLAASQRDTLKKSISDFEATSGVKLDSYNGGNIGRAVRTALQLDTIRTDFMLLHAEQGLARALEAVRACRESATESGSAQRTMDGGEGEG